jgi:hypothetical protein
MRDASAVRTGNLSNAEVARVASLGAFDIICDRCVIWWRILNLLGRSLILFIDNHYECAWDFIERNQEYTRNTKLTRRFCF